MTQKTYNYIKQCLEMGHEVKIKHERDGIVTQQTLVSINENYEEVKDNEVLKIEIIPRIPKLLQPGEKGYIIDTEDIRKWSSDNGWGESHKSHIGGVLKIDCVNYGCYGMENGYRFPYFMVAPVPPEENKLSDVDTEEMVKELESRGLLVNGKVLK